MTLIDWLTLLGVPSLLGFLARWLWVFCCSMRTGMQALLRAQLIGDYNKWTERGYAPIWARDNFENVYEQYHNLGKNGVMDGLHAEFLNLPTEKAKANAT